MKNRLLITTVFAIAAIIIVVFTGDMLWNINDLFLVAGAFVNVALGLAYLYVNLAIYHFLYTMVSNFIKWIQSPSLPIAMKTK